jgi:hypothetical protein
MTENEFRRLALSLPEAVEGAHMGHPDFRVGGKIFASLRSPEVGWAMVALKPEQQEMFVKAVPDVFVPVKGGWGRGGATNVRLARATKSAVLDALRVAWEELQKAKGRKQKAKGKI